MIIGRRGRESVVYFQLERDDSVYYIRFWFVFINNLIDYNVFKFGPGRSYVTGQFSTAIIVSLQMVTN